MKPNPISLIAAFIFLPLLNLAQGPVSPKLLLRTGTVEPVPNITQDKLDAQHSKASRLAGKRYAILQFEQLPSEAEKAILKENGLELLDYVPNNAFTVTISEQPDANLLNRFHARALLDLAPSQKIQPQLGSLKYGAVDVWISFPRSYSFDEVKKSLQQKNFSITDESKKDYRIMALQIPVNRLEELASFPFIEFVEKAPAPVEILQTGFSQWGRDAIKTSALNLPVSNGGKGLNGLGVVIGMGDDADPSQHPDFTGRMISRTWQKWNYHGSHVAGIIGGAGLINEMRKGAAPASTIVVQTMQQILDWAPTYVNDYNMVITNNSYGTIANDCTLFGNYSLLSGAMDQMSFNYSHLQQVFAAGNSGGVSCPPIAYGYRTVLGDYQSAKNVLTVGNTTATGDIFSGSSRGPVRDGRIKPEITAIGTAVTSTMFQFFWNYYADNTGTSMACPAIAGGMALLYEKYRNMHSNADPENVLMKALVVNSGDDYGNPGPDYIYGFGQANFWRAEQMLENNHYVVDSLAAGDPDQSVSITIPAGTAALKVLLCWNDPAASAVSFQALVNDLDLRVEQPSGPALLPFILDTTIAGFANTATTGADHINNIEQVVLSNPTAGGTYTVKIKANNITQGGKQKYVVVYDLVPNEIRLQTPLQSDAYVQGDSVIVQWDCYDEPANTFKLEFAADGSNFVDVNANIPSNKRQYYLTGPAQYWVVPQGISTDQARMRISKNGTSLSYTSGPFLIHDTIQVSLSSDQCPGYFSIDWNAVVGASGYEVMMIRGTEMASVATVSDATLNYTIGGLSRDSVYWVTVRPLINGKPGRRAFAVSRTPNSGNCTNAIFNNDILLDTLMAPVTEGRINTSTSFTSSQPLKIRIINLDNAATPGSINVGYILNNGSPVVETISGLGARDTMIHTFASTADLSAVGNYQFKFFVSQAGDPNQFNDSLAVLVRQLNNSPITGIDYPSTFSEDFESIPSQLFTVKKMGLPGADRFDFAANTLNGRIRSYLNSGLANSGSKAMTMDVTFSFVPLNADSLTGTFDLSNYHAATDDIRLDFQYRNHYQLNYPGNKVWIRAADTSSWIPVYDLYANQNAPGSYKFSGAIELSDSLVARSKDFSSSTQIRWGQEGTFQATNYAGAGYTFDDIRIYRVQDDIRTVSIDTPWNFSCGLNAAVPVKVTIRNNSNYAITGPIPVSYKINNGSYITENAPGLSANSSLQYTFTTPANLSVPGLYVLETVAEYGTDSYALNDTARISVNNQPLHSVTDASPYLQDFESGNGDWFTTGSLSTWEYGTPASYKINRAASGTKAWKTRLAGTYNDGETSYLYSPCFDISTVTSPTLSFSVALDLEDCGGGFCDGAYLEYSVDGVSWARLGATGQGTNWYNRAYSGNNLWSIQNYQRWHVATIPLSVIPVSQSSLTRLRFRFVLRTDAGVNRDGIAFDDFHIYSNANPVYVTTGDGPVINEPNVTPNNWVKFITAGKIVAALNPGNTNMGSTDAQSYIYTGAPRVSSNQFYLNRNITIKPANRSQAVGDSATVRIYFSDAEAEALIAATGCSCSKPTTAYELGVTKYTDPVVGHENGTLSDNSGGVYNFIANAKIKLVPYDVGYYAEFKVKDFSEFWLSNGGLGGNQPLPLTLLNFSAKKQSNRSDVLVTWRTTDEFDLSYFEIEVAKGNNNYQLNRFTTVTRVNSNGGLGIEKEYSYTDVEAGRVGVYYYRLKMVDRNGQFRYSSIKPVVFDNDQAWQLYPNPAENISYLMLQVAEGTPLYLRLIDQNGKIVKQFSRTGTGFMEKLPIELQGIPSGLYSVEVSQGTEKTYFRLLKQ